MNNLWKTMLPDLLPEYYTPEGTKKKIYTKRTKKLMKIIDEGIDTTKAPRDIAIIGAGMSGMVAASLLAGAGHKVAIYEGSTRVGGRILTIRKPFTHDFMGEAGAMRLVSSYQLVYKYIQKFKLKTFDFINHDKDKKELIFVNNVKVTREEYENNPDILKFKTVGDERCKTAQELWTNALTPILDMLTPSANPKKNKDTVANWAKIIERYGNQSVRYYLKEEAKLSEGAIEMIEVMLDLESRSNLSLIQQIVEVTDHDPNATYSGISGGMDRLPKEFYKHLEKLGVAFHFNHMLVGIDRRKDKKKSLTLHFEGSKPRKSNLGVGGGVPAEPVQKKIKTQSVILTIPFPGMRTLKVNPPFSQSKRKVIRELNYNASTKIFLQFSKRFWETKYGIYGGQVVTDLASRFIYFPSTDFKTKNGGVVISSYTWATEARGWDSLTEELRIEYTLNDLAKIFGEEIRDHFVVGTSHSWLLDIYSTGEAAMLSPGQFEELEGFIQMRENNIHFGGDATSFKIAWIEGAIEAGIRTALEVSKEGKKLKELFNM
ncbi:MAG: monoamine oxidase [Saprospiraceae bacterium]|jgi:monoamine oxidase